MTKAGFIWLAWQNPAPSGQHPQFRGRDLSSLQGPFSTAFKDNACLLRAACESKALFRLGLVTRTVSNDLWKVLVMHYPVVEHHGAAPRVIRSCHSLPQEPVKQRLCAVQTRNCGGLASSMFRSKMCLALNSRLAGRWHSALPESRAVSQRRVKHTAKTVHERFALGSWPIDRAYFKGLTESRRRPWGTPSSCFLEAIRIGAI